MQKLGGWFNPFYPLIIPCIICNVMSMLLCIGANIAIYCVPYNSELFWSLAPPNYRTAVVISYVVFPITASLSGVAAGIYTANVFNFIGSVYVGFGLDVRFVFFSFLYYYCFINQ